MPTDLPAIDADGHICERESDVRKYLEPPWDRRATAYRPFDQPWDTSLFGALGQNAAHLAMDPADEVETAWARSASYTATPCPRASCCTSPACSGTPCRCAS